MSAVRAPLGVAVHREGRCTRVARADALEWLCENGFAAPAAWRALLDGARGPGRGGTSRAAIPGGPRLVLKQLRRGGLTARLWRDRFPGAGRLVANLTVPLEAARRGVATPRPVALLLRRATGVLHEGWMAVEEVGGAEDLLSRLRRRPPPERAELAVAAEAVRAMHDAGVEHRDLNLGNLLVAREAGGGPRGFVIDLDRAVLHDGPLPLPRRRAALARLERSWVKHLGDPGPLGAGPRLWYELYAAGDDRLARALSAARPVGRLRLALHRLAWRR